MPRERAPPKRATEPIVVDDGDDPPGHDSPDDSLEEITSAAFIVSAASSRPTTFRHPAPVGSKRWPKTATSGIFNERKGRRPEHHTSHHMNFPLNPNNLDSTRVIPSYERNATSQPMHMVPPSRPPRMWSTHELGAPPPDLAESRASWRGLNTHPEEYMDPKDAENAIKDLLEGAMDEGDGEEDGQDAQAEREEESLAATSAEAALPDRETEKANPGPQEDGSLEGIRVKLLPHQVDGVGWMRQREVGPVKRGKIPKGGILADDMGLGKTLQALSLIISNRRPTQSEKGYEKHFENVERTTLVVAPLALIRQWEAEIKDKVTPQDNLKVCVHHGPQRTKSSKELASYDVVVTTYQILVSEHGRSESRGGGVKAGCFGLHWWRVILDEAHTIKNRNAKSTKACYALRTEYRWCLTGTPLQNNLDELQSLIRFLRVSPYDNLQEWKHSIVQVLNSNRAHIAIHRLHAFLRCIMKRRKKEILKAEGALVPGGKAAMERALAEAAENKTANEQERPMFKTTARNIKPVIVQFSPAERKYYRNLESRADESLSRMMKDGVNYANALVLLLRLRQACNHPNLVASKFDKDKDTLGSQDKQTPGADMDSLADMFGDLTVQRKQCDICLADLNKCEIAAGHQVCAECHGNISSFNHKDPAEGIRKETRRKRKDRVAKDKHQTRKTGKRRSGTSVMKVAVESDEDDGWPLKKHGGRRQRHRDAVVDSDDDGDEDEVEGSWLVGADERGSLHLGKAGGTDDENAEGGGDTIVSSDEDESSGGDGSNLAGFVVNDDETSPDQLIVYSDSDDELPSLARLPKSRQKPSSRRRCLGADGSESSSGQKNNSSSGLSSGRVSGVSDLDDDDDSSLVGWGGHVFASAKIKELVRILGRECPEHKVIVFSQFTSMLNLVEPFLRRHGIGFVRYDGQMRNDMREESLRSLREDVKIRVLLCSLKCGSLGLNLTAATRVVILEPFWNPFVEEQAIDRVHRLTQKVDVTVYKLTVGESVEERILELQEKKRLLAENTIEGSQNKNFKLGLSINELMNLFRSSDPRDPHPSDIQDGKVAAQDVGGIMQSMKGGVGRKPGRETKESEVYGRRW